MSTLTDEIFATYKRYITVEQHGFFSARSILTNLGEFQTVLPSNVGNGFQVDMIDIDLVKSVTQYAMTDYCKNLKPLE